MSFSVVIPTLNEAEFIGPAIRSAWQAGAGDIVVSDGGSEDSTRSIARREGARVVQSPPGRGIQLNRGVGATTADSLIFLHADNRLTSDCGEQLSQAIQSGYPFCCFRQRIDGNRLFYRWIETGNALRARIQKLPYGDQGLSTTRELFETIGGFDEIPLMEDVTFSQKLSRICRPHLLPGPLLVSDRRWRQNGVVRQTFANWLTMARFRFGTPAEALAVKYNRTNQVSPAPSNRKSDGSDRKIAS